MAALARRNREDRNSGPIIEQFEQAASERRPIALWVYTESSERRLQRSREASYTFYEEVLNTPATTALFAECITIKIEIDGLDRDLLRSYRISRNRAPQLILFDYEGNFIGKLTERHSEETMVEAISAALEQCRAMAEREARQR